MPPNCLLCVVYKQLTGPIRWTLQVWWLQHPVPPMPLLFVVFPKPMSFPKFIGMNPNFPTCAVDAHLILSAPDANRGRSCCTCLYALSISSGCHVRRLLRAPSSPLWVLQQTTGLCGVVWCGVVWCGVVRCGAVWRGCGVAVVSCGVVWCRVVWLWCRVAVLVAMCMHVHVDASAPLCLCPFLVGCRFHHAAGCYW
jgi:hypothetical protein